MVNLVRFFEGVIGIAVGLVFVFISFMEVGGNNQLTGIGLGFFLGGILGFILGIIFVYRGLTE